MKTFRILLFNIGYCLGFNGSLPNYFFRSYRYLFCPKKIQKSVLEKLDALIKRKNPDLCCFLEIDQGSKFSNRLNQMQRLVSDSHPFHNVENKYGAWLRSLPIPHFRKQSNGFLAGKCFPARNEFKKHYFKRGAKKLVYEIKMNDRASLFLAHFSLGKKTRKEQMKELGRFLALAGKKKVIVCGDFNIKSPRELDDLLSQHNLNIANGAQDKTFPSHKPKRFFDLFLCSKDIEIKNFEVLENVKISDHLPVMLEVAV